jgi:transposase
LSSHQESPSLRAAVIGGAAAAMAAGVAMAVVRWALLVRTVPERVMEGLLLLVPLDLFELGLLGLGIDAKRYALYGAIAGTLVVLGALGTLVLRRRWPTGAILALGLGLWLFVMLVLLPLTSAGVFAMGLLDGTRANVGGYLTVALVYAATLAAASALIGGPPPATASRREVPEIWAATPAAAQALILAQQERIRDLETRLAQTSANSSRPPSTDPPQAPPRRKTPPTGRKRGGQPGHRGTFRALLPVEQVEEVVTAVPEMCRHCGQPFPEIIRSRWARAWRHQVMELLPLAVRVTEYQMVARRCSSCGNRTRADLPVGVPRRSFGARLTAVVALLSGRYRLSRREVRQLLQDLWQVRVSLGAVVRQEQAQGAALAPVVEEAQAAVQQADAVNMDETGWWQEQRRAWLWTVVTDALTVFWIDRSRGGAVVDALLGSAFTGVVVSDRWSAYSHFPAERRALCHPHLRRDSQALADRGGEAEPVGRWGLADIERLFAPWHRFRVGEFDRPELRRRLIPLQARLGLLLRRGQENPDRKAAGLCRELTKWWPALWTFAQVDGVEPTNNGAERALRPAVLWRKGSFGSDSEAGSRFAERLLTIVATCRQQGRLLDFLVAAGEAALEGSPRPSLLPAPSGY